jgi:anti-sigma B factor antagonist
MALPPEWPSSPDEADSFALTSDASTEPSPRQEPLAKADSCWWRLSGDIDLYAAERLQEEASQIASHGMRTHVDLSGVTFIDAGGVGLLVALRNQLDRNGGRLLLEAVTPHTERILRISGAGTLLRPWEPAAPHLSACS